MPVLIVGTEKNISALRARLFGAGVSSREAREAVGAIREANPDVDLDRLTPGIVLTVPEGIRVGLRGDLSLDESVDEGLDALAAHGRELLEEVMSVAREREREDIAERKSLMTALRSKEVQAAMRKEPALKRDVASVREAISDEEKLAKERVAALGGAADEWSVELDALNTLLKR